jgi:hypothetical protein
MFTFNRNLGFKKVSDSALVQGLVPHKTPELIHSDLIIGVFVHPVPVYLEQRLTKSSAWLMLGDHRFEKGAHLVFVKNAVLVGVD